MTALKKALDDFAIGYEMVTGDMLPKDLRATVKRALLAGVRFPWRARKNTQSNQKGNRA